MIPLSYRPGGNMTILLISLPEKNKDMKLEATEVLPLALYSLSSVLKCQGYEVSIIDPCEFVYLDEKENAETTCVTLIEECLEEGYDIVGFSVNTFNWGITKTVVNQISWKKNTTVVLGGLHVSVFDEYSLLTTKADIIMRGEGELTWCELVATLKNVAPLDTIKGITYKSGKNIIRNPDRGAMTIEDLEALPLPDYELLPIDNPYVEMPVESSRGCQFSCSFCSIPHRHNWRGLCEIQVIERVKHAKRHMKNIMRGGNILFVDDCFSMHPKRAIKILDALHKCYGEEMKYFIEARISNILSGEFLEGFQRNLISQMQIGVECGYDEGLKKIKKGLTIAQLYKGLRIIEEKGLSSVANLSFIIGFPWEDFGTIEKTLDTVEYIVNRFGILCRVNWFMLLPSDIWWERKKYGINVESDIYDNPSWRYDTDIFYSTHPLISEEEINRIEKRIKLIYACTKKISYNRTFAI